MFQNGNLPCMLIKSFSFHLGRHCCLFCQATKEEIQQPSCDRNVTVRTLDTLEENLQDFRINGDGNIKNAKEYFNVINDRLFNIPLNQV